MRKSQEFIIKGMNRDLSLSKFSPELAYENMNLRITVLNSNTLLSVTNERVIRESAYPEIVLKESV